jgi:hypothetical protein
MPVNPIQLTVTVTAATPAAMTIMVITPQPPVVVSNANTTTTASTTTTATEPQQQQRWRWPWRWQWPKMSSVTKHFVQEGHIWLLLIAVLSCMTPVCSSVETASASVHPPTHVVVERTDRGWDIERHTFPGYDHEIISVHSFLNVSEVATITSLLSQVNADEWLYTTNTGPHGAKERSKERMYQRRMSVEKANSKRQFSYSKYELPVDHVVVTALKAILQNKRTMRDLSSLFRDTAGVGVEARHMTELFAAKYTMDDFLSWHGDGSAGSVAFVLSLTDNWDTAQDGGALQFQCFRKNPATGEVENDRNNDHVCMEIKPSFNTLVMFRTRYHYLREGKSESFALEHRVDRVRTESKDRIAITGWYLCRGDVLSQWEQKVCADMKGSSCLVNDDDDNEGAFEEEA